MTTVLGIRPQEIEAVVLIADRQTTTTDRKTGFPKGKYLGRKLWIEKQGNYCLGHSGCRDNETEEFVTKLTNGEYDISKIIKKGYFPELRKLNLKRLGRELPSQDRLSGFLLATRFDNVPKLYTCFPLGSVQQRVWTAMGSGYPKIEEYMNALEVLTQATDYTLREKKPNVQDLIRVGLEAARRSQSQDIYSHGLDLLVITPEKINDHSADLGDDFDQKLKKIQEAYK